jgi:Holliday junction DNA helicase RuvA
VSKSAGNDSGKENMIGKLRGTVDVVGTESAILDVNGVGYVVHCPTATLAALVPGETASVHVETHVREDMIRLFGFATAGELEWFRLLQGVQGVGSKVALSILGTLAGPEIAAAIDAQDAKAFARTPGIGARLGQRIAAELKGRVPEGLATAAGGLPAPAGGDAEEVLEAASALANLGYARSQALVALRAIVAAEGAGLEVKSLIRRGLKALSAK